MGRVRETPLPTNDETNSSTGRVRETPHPLNEETDCSTGRVKRTVLPTIDDTSRDRAYKIDSTPDVRPNIFHDGVCKTKSPPAERDGFQNGTSKKYSKPDVEILAWGV